MSHHQLQLHQQQLQYNGNNLDNASVVRELSDAMIDDVVLHMVLDLHRSAKLATMICHHCGRRCRDFGPINGDVHIHDPTALTLIDRVTCQHCQKSVGSSLFARHLEKCMGLQGARGANRRHIIKSYAEDDSSPEKKRKKSAKKSSLSSSSSGSNSLFNDTASLDSCTSTQSNYNTTTPIIHHGDISNTSIQVKKPPVKRRKRNSDPTSLTSINGSSTPLPLPLDDLPQPPLPKPLASKKSRTTKKLSIPIVKPSVNDTISPLLVGHTSSLRTGHDVSLSSIPMTTIELDGLPSSSCGMNEIDPDSELFDIDENDLDVVFE